MNGGQRVDGIPFGPGLGILLDFHRNPIFRISNHNQRTTTTNRTLPTYDLVGTHHCSSDYQSSSSSSVHTSHIYTTDSNHSHIDQQVTVSNNKFSLTHTHKLPLHSTSDTFSIVDTIHIMTTTASVTAPIKWAQRADSLYLTIALAGTFRFVYHCCCCPNPSMAWCDTNHRPDLR